MMDERARVKYDENLPPEVAEAVAPLLSRWLPLLPRWVHGVYVSFGPGEDDGDSLSCGIAPEYRQMSLYVHPAWLAGDARKRSGDVLHEILHAHMETARDVFLSLLKATTEEGPLHSWAREEYRKALECGVNDMEDAILRWTGS